MLSREHMRLPKPSADKHTLSVALLSLEAEGDRQLRHTMSSYHKRQSFHVKTTTNIPTQKLKKVHRRKRHLRSLKYCKRREKMIIKVMSTEAETHTRTHTPIFTDTDTVNFCFFVCSTFLGFKCHINS